LFDYDEAKSMKLMTSEEEREATRDELVTRNLRLAFFIANKWRGNDVDFDDLRQEAIEGLMVAAGKFDPDKGRFTTIATQWVTHHVRRAVQKSRVLDRAINDRSDDEDRPVLVPAATSGEEGFVDPACALERPDDLAERSLMREYVLARLSTMSEKHQQVVSLYYGFDGDVPKTLKQIAETVGLSFQRVAQIRAEAEREILN